MVTHQPTDPISDVLTTIKLSGVIFLRAHMGGAYGIEMPPPTLFHPIVKRPTEEHRLVMFHIVREGGGYVEIEGSGAHALGEGDLVLVFEDVVHSMVDQPGRPTIPSRDLVVDMLHTAAPPEAHVGQGERSLRLVCGMLQFVERGINPIFSSLPPYLIIRAHEGPPSPWLQANLNYIVAEAESGREGSLGLLSRLTELMFIETLRSYLRTLPESERGWFAALRDPIVGPALQLLHASPARDWTVAALAKRVGASRSSFSARFSDLLDTSPIAYLTRWRIRQATNLLDESKMGVGEVASLVGYESESAFHRAFKREMGISPSAWRSRSDGQPPP